MKRVLIVGYDYSYTQDLNETYKNCLFIPANEVEHESAERTVELVRMVDEVLFLTDGFISVEVAAVMMDKKVVKKADYPIKSESEEEA